MPTLTQPTHYDRHGEDRAHSAWHKRTEDPEAIAEMLEALVSHRTTGVVVREGVRFPIRPVSIQGDSIRWRVSAAIVSAPCQIELEGYNSVFSVPVEHLVQRGDTLITPLPKVIHESRRRWHRRAVPEESMQVRILEDESGVEYEGRVINLSYAGLLVELPSDAALVPGQRLSYVMVHRQRRAVSLTCEVVVSKGQSGGRQFGLRIVGARSPLNWQTWVDDCLHPSTRAGGQHAEAQWRLFDRCGYFSLSKKTPEDFAHLRRAYVRTTEQLHKQPHLASQVVWGSEEEEEVTAAATAVKVYDGTWLGIQMAKDQGDAPDGTPGRQVLRELNYRVYEHVQLDPGLRWFFTCIQNKEVWTRYVFHDFPQSLEESGDASIVRFRALEVDANRTWQGAQTEGVEVDIARPEELDTLCRHIADTRSVAYRESLDLVRERIDMKANQTMWKRSRLERERVILVARKNGRATAAAVVERAPDGVHLFGLLDLVRLFPLVEGGEAQFGDLLDKVSGYFAYHEKSSYVCYLEEGVVLDDSLVAQTTDLGEADMCILAAWRIPELLENIHKVAAPTSSRSIGPRDEVTHVG